MITGPRECLRCIPPGAANRRVIRRRERVQATEHRAKLVKSRRCRVEHAAWDEVQRLSAPAIVPAEAAAALRWHRLQRGVIDACQPVERRRPAREPLGSGRFVSRSCPGRMVVSGCGRMSAGLIGSAMR